MNIDQRKIHTSEATDGGFIRILQAASTWFLLGNIPTEQLKLTVEVPTQSGGRGNLGVGRPIAAVLGLNTCGILITNGICGTTRNFELGSDVAFLASCFLL